MSVLDELVRMETEGWQALTTPSGADYYDEHLTANAMMAFPFGVMGREEAVESLRAGDPWASFEISEPQVVELTDDSAILVYRASAQREGAPAYTAVMTSVFVREDGRWLLAFHQQSPT
ncbi:nuclear transport factor 2 family protein [Nocardioides antri]|uniref:nuclear transport factor 2 family protein n=1 Tax=Nocardioides antri TaxID=2607659 RepID=UPI00165F1D24|nr:nuclear transport factor 2 family protein [Nocardioides antri]